MIKDRFLLKMKLIGLVEPKPCPFVVVVVV